LEWFQKPLKPSLTETHYYSVTYLNAYIATKSYFPFLSGQHLLQLKKLSKLGKLSWEKKWVATVFQTNEVVYTGPIIISFANANG